MWNKSKSTTEKPKIIARSVDICQKCGSRMTCLFAFYICDRCEPPKPSIVKPPSYANKNGDFFIPVRSYPTIKQPLGTIGTTWYASSTKSGKKSLGGYTVTRDLPTLRSKLAAKAKREGKARFIYAVTDAKFDPSDTLYFEPDPSDPNSGSLVEDVTVDYVEKIDP